MSLQNGLIIINERTGFYYTPPDNITRCLLTSAVPGNSPNKYELQAILNESAIMQIRYRELLDNSSIFKLALFRYQSQNISVNIMDHNFDSERLYAHKIMIHNEQYYQLQNKWLEFFERTSATQLLTS